MELGVTDRPRDPTPATVAQVEYTLEPEDYVDGYLFLWVKGLRARIRVAVVALATSAVVFVLFLVPFLWLILNEPSYVLFWVPLAILLALSYSALLQQTYMVLIPYRRCLRRKHLSRVVKAQYGAGFIRPRRADCLYLTPTGFTELNKSSEFDQGVSIVEAKEFRVLWPVVEAIDVAERVAVFTVRGKGFLFLPKHAFRTEDAFLNFVRTAKELQRAFDATAAATSPAPGLLSLSDGLRKAP